jgi:hypothetical protein
VALIYNGFRIESNVRARFNGRRRNEAVDKQSKRNIYVNDTIDKKAAVTSGNLAPGAWVLPQKSGGMASFTLLKSESEFSLTLVPTIPMTLSLSGSLNQGTITLDSNVPIFSDMAASLSLTSASLVAAASASADLSASGVLAGTCGAIVPVFSSMSADLSAGNALTAFANIECSIGGPTPLSPEGLANAVWDTVLADHVDAGTTGAALSDAGGAGNPWSADLATNNTAGTFGGFVQKLLTVAKFLGLK